MILGVTIQGYFKINCPVERSTLHKGIFVTGKDEHRDEENNI
jgi:hypothetical protein